MHPLYQIQKNTKPKRGPSAIVWQARDEVLDRGVALKELRNWAARPPRARGCFQFAHLRRLTLDHPGLVPVLGTDSERGWIVLEHFPQGSLTGQEDPMPAVAVRRALVDVLGTLSYLHGKRRLHGAVKSANLFTLADGRTLLGDGIDLRLDDAGRISNLRGAFEIGDTLDGKYLAPECLEPAEDRIGPAADLYALGWSTLELLLGEAWFASLFPMIRVAAQRWDEWHASDETLPPLRQIASDAPADLAELIDGLLRKDPSERPTIERALAILNAAPRPKPASGPRPVERAPSAAAPTVTAVAETTEIAAPVRRRGRAGLIVGSAGVALGIGLGVVLGPVASPYLPAALKSKPAGEKAAGNDAAFRELATARAQVEQQKASLRDLTTLLDSRQRDLDDARSQIRGPVATLVSNPKGAAETERLAEELKIAHDEGTRLVGEIEKQRAEAAKLAIELKSTQEQLAAARVEIDSLNVRLAAMPPIPVRSIPEVLAAVKELGGSVDVDGSTPPRVVKLDLARSKASNDDLSLLTSLPELRSLSLSSTAVSDAGLRQVRSLAKLQSLRLAATQISDEGLAQVAGMSTLQELDLAGTPISDAGLARLKTLTKLRQIYITSTRVTAKGVAEFQKALPSCQVQHESLWTTRGPMLP
jgi:Protein kinase domain/Leucine Rich repeat